MTFQEELNKTTNSNIRLIAEYLLSREDMKDKLEKENKSLKDMWKFIVSNAKKATSDGCACVSDEEVFGWAVHYYDEDDLKFDDKAINSLEYARNSKSKPQKVDTNNDFVEDNKKVETLEKTIQMLETKLEEATQKLQESEVVNEDSAADPIEDAKPKAKKKKKATVVPEEQLSMFDFLVR